MKKFKAIFCILVISLSVFAFYGCKDNEPEYKVICADHFENVKEGYKAGEKVVIYDRMSEDDHASVYYYVDGVQPETRIPDPDSDYPPEEATYAITFTMPKHDVKLTKKIEHNAY